MKQTVEHGRTLLVDGPAAVKVASGRAEVFGFQIKQTDSLVIREGKRLPFFALEQVVFEVSLGANASMEEVEGSTIPLSWIKPLETILSLQRKPVVVFLVGKGDSGKSSFCTFLVNKLVSEKRRVAVLDGDIGQSDIGPSGTIAYALASKPVTELYELKLGNAFFVGVTSPIWAIAKTVEGYGALREEISARAVDFVLVNTDGWISGKLAVKHKMLLIEKLNPDLVVCVEVEDELEPLLNAIQEIPIVCVQTSSSLKARSAEKRKSLREMSYAKYLKGAKLQTYRLSLVTVEPKNALQKGPGEEKGLLAGLYDSSGKFLGVGVLSEVNQARRALKIRTAVLTKPSRIVVGKIRLDAKLKEITEQP